jgi:hypothetical protein
MVDEDRHSLRAAQRPYIAHIDIAVTIEIEPQAPHRVDRYPEIRGPAGIVRVVHEATLTPDDLFGYLFDALHPPVPSCLCNMGERMGVQ